MQILSYCFKQCICFFLLFLSLDFQCFFFFMTTRYNLRAVDRQTNKQMKEKNNNNVDIEWNRFKTLYYYYFYNIFFCFSSLAHRPLLQSSQGSTVDLCAVFFHSLYQIVQHALVLLFHIFLVLCHTKQKVLFLGHIHRTQKIDRVFDLGTQWAMQHLIVSCLHNIFEWPVYTIQWLWILFFFFLSSFVGWCFVVAVFFFNSF